MITQVVIHEIKYLISNGRELLQKNAMPVNLAFEKFGNHGNFEKVLKNHTKRWICIFSVNSAIRKN